MSSFDGTTMVRPTGQPGTFDADFDGNWRIGGGVNGGVILAAAARGLAATFDDDRHPDPLAVTASYLTASVPGPVRIECTVAHRSGGLSTGTATVLQTDGDHEQPRAVVQGMFGDLSRLPEVSNVTIPLPDNTPGPDDCIPSSLAPPELLAVAPILSELDLRFTPDSVGWTMGKPTGRGVLEGWLKFADDRDPDPWALLYAVDALPPAVADLGLGGWAPTLQLSAYVRAKPAPGWLFVRHQAGHVSGGQFEEDSQIWDSTGTLVAQGRQLARTPRPPK